MNAEDFEPLDDDLRQRLLSIGRFAPFPKLVGLQMEDVRKEYARMRMPYRPELDQPAGIIHGGAIATLIDTVVVGTILSNVPSVPKRIVTIDLHVHYMDAAVAEDLVAVGTTRRRGRSTVFVAVDVASASGKAIAHGELSYRVFL